MKQASGLPTVCWLPLAFIKRTKAGLLNMALELAMASIAKAMLHAFSTVEVGIWLALSRLHLSENKFISLFCDVIAPRKYAQTLQWLRKVLRPNGLVIVLSALIGLTVGMAAVGLKTMLYFLESSVLGYFPRFLLFFLPMFGILAAVSLNRSWFRENPQQMGLAGILYAISRQNAFVRRSLMYSQVLLSSVTLAFGGSVGFEAPMVVTGSAWGSNIARFFRLDFRQRTLLIGCGTAAGISAIFNAPIAGVIFAMEIILPEITTARFIPILISAAMGNLLSSLFLDNEAIFRVNTAIAIGWGDVFWVLLLGLLAGIYAVWFTRTILVTGKYMRKIRTWWHKALIGGLFLGGIIYFLPPLYGEGYTGLRSVIDDQAVRLIEQSRLPGLTAGTFDLLLFLGALLIFRPIAAAITVEAGGIGGIFAPSVVSGGFLGYVFALSLNSIVPSLNLHLVNFTLFGMAAALSGVMHAPLTAIFLVAEITGSYDIIVPLMLVSAMAYFTKTYLQPLSLVAGRLMKAGDLIHGDKDKQVLLDLDLSNFIEKDILPVRSGSTLGDLVKLIATCRRNIFPVIDDHNQLLGVILLDNIRQVIFDQAKYHQVLVNDLMQSPPAEVPLGSSMEEVMEFFDQTEAWNLPVVKKGIYVGFISKSTIFGAYRDQLKING
jgi:CIC family chloride channel protein